MKLSIVLSMFLIGISAGFSQVNEQPEIKKELLAEYQTGTPDDIAQLQTNRMKTALDLSDAQEPNVYFLNKKVAEKIAAIQKNADLTDDKKQEYIKGNLIDRRRAMSSILTPDQLEKFDELDY